MSARSHTSFQKRQKEIARIEKQRDKAAKRAQRRLEPAGSQNNENPSSVEAPSQPETALSSEK
jgi:hypothetical protein